MGIADRDYARERRDGDDQAFRRLPAAGASRLGPIVFWLTIAAMLFLGFKWAEQRDTARRDRDRQARAFPAISLPIVPRDIARHAPADQTVQRQRAQSPGLQPAKPVSKCVRNGATSYSDTGCEAGVRGQPVQAAIVSSQRPVQGTPSSGSAVATPGTIYLCKAYDGGTFWAQAHCNQHRAHIERIARVPDGMPFEQQVAVAKQQSRAADPPPPSMAMPDAAAVHASAMASQRCAALEQEIRRIDELARQPLPPQEQDRLAARRKEARGEQFRIPCR